ncbi:hypothetical protein Mgra_00006652 [Meloidogyne graminicola]|uniref:Uncharacterized protein n=1 Tax=Meloidogyne graminicola TaxID=189291 RepID=A0A8S9ZKE2_9BILA|nr:hypothetical protein Mgra_00006652 [Meloidogyne graminicola]
MLSLICLAFLLLYQPNVIFSVNDNNEAMEKDKKVLLQNEQQMFNSIVKDQNPWEIQKKDSKEFKEKVEQVIKGNFTRRQTPTVRVKLTDKVKTVRLKWNFTELKTSVSTVSGKRGKYYDTSIRWAILSACAVLLAVIMILLGWEHCNDEDQAD